MTNTITVSAPGKLMLIGEHAVVYNYPCIVTAVGQRMGVTVAYIDQPRFELEAPDVNIVGYGKAIEEIGTGDMPKGASFVEVAVKNFLEKHPLHKGIRVITTSEFSSQFGFGSSSASTVCTIKALSELGGAELSNKDLFDVAYKTVLDIQGKGSGFDVAAAIYGGTLYFVTAGKIIEPLPTPQIPLIVGYTGVKADTTALVKQVALMRDTFPEKVNKIFAAIGQLVDQAKPKLLAGDWTAFGKFMNFDQEYLRDLGVSSQVLEDLIHAANGAGATGAKLSGAGGGDCMIAIASEEKKHAVAEALSKAGGKILDVDANVEGVRVEN